MLNVTINNNANALAPGYLFVAPYNVDQPAPYIYDGQGVCCPGENLTPRSMLTPSRT